MTEITPHMTHTYLKTRQSNHNYNVHRKEIRALFNFAINHLEIINYNPVRKLEVMPHTPSKKHIPTEEEILRIIMAADPETERPLIQVILNTLGRNDEVLRLTWEDVNFVKRTVTLYTRKRKDGAFEPDELPINGDLYQVLWDLWQRRKQNQWVSYNEKTGTTFHNRSKLMRSLCKRAGIPHFGFHDLRHFMASFLSDRKKQSTKTISKLVRHKNTWTTEIYLHSIDNAAREAMRSVEGEFSIKTTTKSHYQNKVVKIKNGATN